MSCGEMVYEAGINAMEKSKERDVFEVKTKEEVEIPGHSGVFVKLTTNGKLPLRVDKNNSL
jgi:hypothetical protein